MCDRRISRVTWVKEASIHYVAIGPDAVAKIDTHEHNVVLHVFVVWKDGSTNEWDKADHPVMPPWAEDAIEWATQPVYRR